jgi:cobalt-zinc-cadmium efflux system outer membrane protein
MLFRFLVALILANARLFPVVAQVAAVQPPPSSFLDSKTGITESQLVVRALALNPTLAAARHDIDIARDEVTQAGLRKNPALSLGGMQEISGQDNRVSVGASLPLELHGRRSLRTTTAARKLDVTRENIRDKERILAGEVRVHFGETLAAIRNLRFVEQLLKINRDFLALTESRVSEGATAPHDADVVRVEVNRIDALRVDNLTKTEVALLRLKQSVGMQPEDPLVLNGSLEDSRISADQSQFLKLALAHRPDLIAQRGNEAVSLAELRMREAEAKPDASVSASYERPNSGFSQRAFNSNGTLSPIRQTFNYAVVGIDITLPAFNRNQGAIAAGAAAIDAARDRISAADLVVRYEIAENQARYKGAQARIAIYGSGVRDQAARNLEVVRQIYTYGRNTLLDVITEQRRYIEIETGYTDVLLDGYAARVGLEQAVGTSLH